jgi:hypothetical protein
LRQFRSDRRGSKAARGVNLAPGWRGVRVMLNSVGWFAAIGVAAIVEFALLMRLAASLGRGEITMDVLFWITWRAGLDVTAERSKEPILYWTGTLGLFAAALMVAGVMAAIYTRWA